MSYIFSSQSIKKNLQKDGHEIFEISQMYVGKNVKLANFYSLEII